MIFLLGRCLSAVLRPWSHGAAVLGSGEQKNLPSSREGISKHQVQVTAVCLRARLLALPGAGGGEQLPGASSTQELSPGSLQSAVKAKGKAKYQKSLFLSRLWAERHVVVGPWCDVVA